MDGLKLRRTWRELWFKMAKGDLQQYETIKATDVFEFWTLYGLWITGIKKENSKLKNNKQNGPK